MMLSLRHAKSDRPWVQTDSFNVPCGSGPAELEAGRGKVRSVYVPALSKEERRRQRRATAKYRSAHATRERVRVVAFNVAFAQLRKLLPILPQEKRLSKIEILRLAICYITYLRHVLDVEEDQ
ncbi:nhlh2 [Pungitius sinensis]